MRRLVPAILALAAVVSGCGSSHSVAAHSPVSHGKPLTKAQAETYAREINLRAADLPDMPAISAEGEPAASYVTTEAPRCGGGGALAEPGAIRSSRFAYPLSLSTQARAPGEVVGSSVRLAASAARAAQDIAADQSVGVRNCFGRVLRAAGGDRGPLLQKTVVVSLRPHPLPAARTSFALAVTLDTVYLSAKPGGHRSSIERALDRIRSNSTFTQDILGFASGPAEITLTDVHRSGEHPLAKERRLLSLLYRRAVGRAL